MTIFEPMVKILFVCLGNICRSPMAEAIFNQQIKKLGLSEHFQADSAGTSSYHIGNEPDPRALLVLRKHLTPLKHKARQFKKGDFNKFDYIMVMDRMNYQDIKDLKPDRIKKDVLYLRQFDELNFGNKEVPDPYYGNEDDFLAVYKIIEMSVIGFIKYLKNAHPQLKEGKK